MNAGLFGIGVLIAFFGVVAYGVANTTDGVSYLSFDRAVYHPYSSYGAPLLIIGFLLIGLGALIPSVRTVTERTVVDDEPQPRGRRRTRVIEEVEM